jgi:hypothetical protein
VTRSGTLRAFRWLQLGTLSIVLIVLGLVLLSGLGTMLATSTSQPTVAAEGKVVSLALRYHSLDPGPFSTDAVVVSVSLLDANGSVLLSAWPQSFRVGAFTTASGNFTFTLDFSQLPQAAFDSFRSSTSPLTLRIGISSGLGGLVHVEVTSNLTVSGVE